MTLFSDHPQDYPKRSARFAPVAARFAPVAPVAAPSSSPPVG